MNTLKTSPIMDIEIMEKYKNTLTWIGIKHLQKIVKHLISVANEIDELGVSPADYGRISEILNNRQNVTLLKLKRCCDEMIKIEAEQTKLAEEFEQYLKGS